ncbi:hypothetical protein ACHAXA_003214 [Cyclostephanos tholiformis]|uniref:Uncharacterized protein n=1 Tax=Cyclostephanos tholiformis TaxID=382380 RepID=A0ABD3RYK8_9STRA
MDRMAQHEHSAGHTGCQVQNLDPSMVGDECNENGISDKCKGMDMKMDGWIGGGSQPGRDSK